MTGFASTQCFGPGRARMNDSIQQSGTAICRIRTQHRPVGVTYSGGDGISGYFNLMPRHAAIRMMSCFDADLRRWSSTLLRIFTISISGMIRVPQT